MSLLPKGRSLPGIITEYPWEQIFYPARGWPPWDTFPRVDSTPGRWDPLQEGPAGLCRASTLARAVLNKRRPRQQWGCLLRRVATAGQQCKAAAACSCHLRQCAGQSCPELAAAEVLSGRGCLSETQLPDYKRRHCRSAMQLSREAVRCPWPQLSGGSSSGSSSSGGLLRRGAIASSKKRSIISALTRCTAAVARAALLKTKRRCEP